MKIGGAAFVLFFPLERGGLSSRATMNAMAYDPSTIPNAICRTRII
jgi:hypothetical protein